jgi:hypothetical protein
MSEWDYSGDVKRGDKTAKAKLVQEWLCLQGVGVAIDKDFGPATEAGVKAYQAKRKLPVSGVVDKATFDALVAPMVAAMKPIAAGGKSLGELVVAYAQQHLAQLPREIGGENMGPWVRLYTGREGKAWAWCAGFTCTCLKQACATLGAPMPFPFTLSCDVLAMNGKSRKRFLPQPTPSDRGKAVPGSFFLVRKTSTDWTHTGIVVGHDGNTFRAIEGNTNDSGSREGYEVCARVRGYDKKDFVIV